MSSLLARKIRVRLLFMYFFYSIPKSVPLGWFSLRERQLFAPSIYANKWLWFKTNNLVRVSIMVLVYAAPKLNSSLVTNVLFVQLEDVEGVFNAR